MPLRLTSRILSAIARRFGDAGTGRIRAREAVRQFPKILSLAAALMLAAPATTTLAEEDEACATAKPVHLVVLGPPETFNDTAENLGFLVVEQTLLRTLGVNAVRLRIPKGETADSAIVILRALFPNLVFGGEDFEEMDTSGSPKPAT